MVAHRLAFLLLVVRMSLHPLVWLLDSSGQELESLLDNKDEYDLAFDNTDKIIYILDYPTWMSSSEEIILEVQKINGIIKNNSYLADIVLFFHKIDLIGIKNRKGVLKEITNKFKERIGKQVNDIEDKNEEQDKALTKIQKCLIFLVNKAGGDPAAMGLYD